MGSKLVKLLTSNSQKKKKKKMPKVNGSFLKSVYTEWSWKQLNFVEFQLVPLLLIISRPEVLKIAGLKNFSKCTGKQVSESLLMACNLVKNRPPRAGVFLWIRRSF